MNNLYIASLLFIASLFLQIEGMSLRRVELRNQNQNAKARKEGLTNLEMKDIELW